MSPAKIASAISFFFWASTIGWKNSWLLRVHPLDAPSRCKSEMQTLSILGVPVDAFSSVSAAAEFVCRRIAANQNTFCVAANPEKLYRAQRDRALRDILLNADMRICDGVGLSLAGKLLHGWRLPRCTGVDLFLALVAMAEKQRWKIFLLGASPESNEGARRELFRRFPELRIVGARNGFFEDSNLVVDEINASG